MANLPLPINVAAEPDVFQARPSATTALPVPHSTHSFWIDSEPNASPHATDGSEGSLTADADVCIIGSGITGVSAAYHLGNAIGGSGHAGAAPPLKAVILEAREFCSGATGRNGGHLAPVACTSFRHSQKLWGTDETLRWLALEKRTAAEMVKIIREHKLENAVDFVSGGRIELYFTEEAYSDARADYAAAKAAGADLQDVEWLSKEEIAATYGAAFPGARMPGNNLWPLKFVSQLYELATALPGLDLTLHTRTPVTSIAPTTTGGRRWSLTTPRGNINCSYVLHATNAYASHLIPHMAGPTGIVPTRGQVVAMRAAALQGEITTSAWLGNTGLEYWFPRPVKGAEAPLVIFGGGREAAENAWEFGEADDSVIDKKAGRVLREFLPSVFPGKFAVNREPEMEWTGIMGFTSSQDPFVGPVIDPSDPTSAEKHKGQYMSAGYTGHGMPRAYSCAEVVAGMIVADLADASWSPPDWLPRHYLITAPVRSNVK